MESQLLCSEEQEVWECTERGTVCPTVDDLVTSHRRTHLHLGAGPTTQDVLPPHFTEWSPSV